MASITSPYLRILATLFLVIGTYAYYVLGTIPESFPVGKNFIVEEGESLRSISHRLEDEHYIRSAVWFRAWISFLGRDRHVQLGGYVFDEPLPLGSIVHRLVFGRPNIPLISVTIPEGSTTYEIAVLFQKALPHFSIDIFGEKVSAVEADGKLFPSTYFLLPSTTENQAVTRMVDTFERKYAENFAKVKIPSPLKDKNDVINLAAILEGEAKTQVDMQIVAGILLKRLTVSMALQVDAAPETYKTRGLPRMPINNPGLVALQSVFEAASTPYLYYITGDDGTMHYAKTFEEHKKNIQKYLK
jgi:UPF0755 protein